MDWGLAVLLGFIALVVSVVVARNVCNGCPRCKIKLVEESTGDANFSGTFCCPKCGYRDE